MVVTSDETRDEIAEALAYRNFHSKRQQHLVGSPEHPTPWDNAHAALNLLLDALEAAPDA